MTSTGRRLKELIGQDKEVAPAPSPRDGRELWSDKEEHEAVDFGKGSLPKRDNPVLQVTVG